ncbi:hypothetical protein HRbin10_01683 [bacterium HR10]|nr:hypothetical protein HRbin10_01683 [bacterium HR10]
MEILKLVAAIQGVYGVLNLLGGIFADAYGLPMKPQLGFALAGFAQLASAVGLWRSRRWAAVVTLLTLIALSALALYTDLALSKGLQIVDHLIRAAIGLGIAALILMRWKHLD